MRELANMIDELHRLSAESGPDFLLDEVLARTGYLRMLEEKNTVEDTTRAENVRELKSTILGYQKESGDNTLSGFLADVALYTDLDNYDRESDSVVMMTMHAAKGLEFPTVFIVGMEEGIFPGQRAIGEPEEMEEERRLCYVAITRAREHLHLICARQRMIFGRTNAYKPSRFVDELPEETLDKKNEKRGYGYHDNSYSDSCDSSYSYRRSADNYRTTTRKTAPIAAPRDETPKASFAVGDRVEHKAFGVGSLTKMTPMGGDFLIEVQFERAGIKKLMLRIAAQNMKKLD